MSASDPPPEENSPLRKLPSVERVIAELDDAAHPTKVDAARGAIDAAREMVVRGDGAPSFEDIVADARGRLAAGRRASLVPVINATGVLLHTNLGRTPLADEALERVAEVAHGYSNLEYDLERGARGSRYAHAAAGLVRLSGAEAALVVNNNAAAVLLVLSTLCTGREVIISRGELVEIGGEFRIPDVMTAAGATLVEVGTTNRTHIGDYERAIGPLTAALMKVHASNFKVVGFTAAVDQREVGRLARGRGVPFIEDLGSGLMTLDDAVEWTRPEPPVRTSVEAGADLVTFSGDKLLGGPQAGIILGRSELIARLKKNPLLRAVRVDKMTLAALQATLDAYLEDRWRDLPLWQMALAPAADIEARVRLLTASLGEFASVGVKVEAVPVVTVAGGGSLPGGGIPSWAVAIDHPEIGPADLHASLRTARPAVVGRVEAGRLLLDLRTVRPEQDEAVTAVLRAILG